MKKKKLELPQPNEQMALLAQTVQCNNQEALELIIDRALRVIHKPRFLEDESMNDTARTNLLALIGSINPKDTIEVMLASQFITLHVKALSAIAEDNYYIMAKAMAMLRLSQHALSMLQAYRGKSQTINVNYNVLNQGNAILNTLIKPGEI